MRSRWLPPGLLEKVPGKVVLDALPGFRGRFGVRLDSHHPEQGPQRPPGRVRSFSKTGEDFHLGLWTLATIPFFALVLWLGWQKVRNNEPKSEIFS